MPKVNRTVNQQELSDLKVRIEKIVNENPDGSVADTGENVYGVPESVLLDILNFFDDIKGIL